MCPRRSVYCAAGQQARHAEWNRNHRGQRQRLLSQLRRRACRRCCAALSWASRVTARRWMPMATASPANPIAAAEKFLRQGSKHSAPNAFHCDTPTLPVHVHRGNTAVTSGRLHRLVSRLRHQHRPDGPVFPCGWGRDGRSARRRASGWMPPFCGSMTGWSFSASTSRNVAGSHEGVALPHFMLTTGLLPLVRLEWPEEERSWPCAPARAEPGRADQREQNRQRGDAPEHDRRQPFLRFRGAVLPEHPWVCDATTARCRPSRRPAMPRQTSRPAIWLAKPYCRPIWSQHAPFRDFPRGAAVGPADIAQDFPVAGIHIQGSLALRLGRHIADHENASGIARIENRRAGSPFRHVEQFQMLLGGDDAAGG